MTHLAFWAEAATGRIPSFLRGVVAPCAAPAVPALLGRRRLVAAGIRLLSQLRVALYRTARCQWKGRPRLRRGPRAGQRLPDATVTCGGRRARLHELLARPGIHVLLHRDAVQIEQLPFGRYVTFHRLTSSPGRGLVAVRPDGYVGFRCGSAEGPAAERLAGPHRRHRPGCRYRCPKDRKHGDFPPCCLTPPANTVVVWRRRFLTGCGRGWAGVRRWCCWQSQLGPGWWRSGRAGRGGSGAGCGVAGHGGCRARVRAVGHGRQLRRGRIGVDVIALLALAGALAVGELLAAAVISVMLASGRALEAWAAGRARRDLHALLERAPGPRAATRSGPALETVPLDAVAARRPAAGGARRAGAGRRHRRRRRRGAGRVGADRRGAARWSGRRGSRCAAAW